MDGCPSKISEWGRRKGEVGVVMAWVGVEHLAKISDWQLVKNSKGECEGGVVSAEYLGIGGHGFKKMSVATPYD